MMSGWGAGRDAVDDRMDRRFIGRHHQAAIGLIDEFEHHAGITPI